MYAQRMSGGGIDLGPGVGILMAKWLFSRVPIPNVSEAVLAL